MVTLRKTLKFHEFTLHYHRGSIPLRVIVGLFFPTYNDVALVGRSPSGSGKVGECSDVVRLKHGRMLMFRNLKIALMAALATSFSLAPAARAGTTSPITPTTDDTGRKI